MTGDLDSSMRLSWLHGYAVRNGIKAFENDMKEGLLVGSAPDSFNPRVVFSVWI